MDQSRIRNFCVVAHIDHGKSTLADRFLELTHAVSERQMREQYLDRMDLERERGITIKAQAVRLAYPTGGTEYELNLIDTPGHVDFTYEVSRSLAACEGVVLLVDAAQGIEAQTLANLHLAREAGLAIVPAVNKIDLAQSDPDEVARELAELVGVGPSDVLRVSAKTGEGITGLLDAIVARVPPPAGNPAAPLRALIFDSSHDPYRGVIAYLRVVDGQIRSRSRILLMSGRLSSETEEVGVFAPDATPIKVLAAGEVGYLVTGVRDVRQAQVGDTVTLTERPAKDPLPGYREPKPMVWSGLYPAEGGDYPMLRDALDKLKLSDAALVYEPESSLALGFGFRCGFLGLLHMDIVKERLEREFALELIATAPTVEFRVVRGQEVTSVHNPSEMPTPGTYDHVEEPYVLATVVTPSSYLGPVMELCQQRRGSVQDMRYLSPERAEVHYLLPLAEIIFDFFDLLKSRTRGYASLDYEHQGYEQSDLVRVDVLLQGEPVDAFSAVVPRDRAQAYGRTMTNRLRELIPRQMYEVAIQAAIGSRIIARETVRAKRKDVLAKCYGGDVTRKRKLLERQKEGKKRMRRVGRVDVPQEAFIAALRVDHEPAGEAVVTARAGLYVHIPFCLTRCGYCDFNTYAGLDHLAGSYVGALETEVGMSAPQWDRTEFVSVFLGGGTPTTLPPEAIQGLLSRIRDVFRLTVDAEVTSEANPDTVDAPYLAALREAGVDRLSIGVQSFDPAVLDALERIHGPESARAAFSAARAAGFDNVNLDLIYGAHGETLESWRRTLEEATELRPEHLSCYALTIEPATPLGRKVAAGIVPAPDPDLQANMYDLTCNLLRAAGYEHYEVSNWAMPGRRCTHNMGYWEGRPYLGLGAGAHSFRDGRRWWNVRPPQQYMGMVEAGQFPESGAELLTDDERRMERLLLGLRTSEGVPFDWIDSSRANAFVAEGLAVRRNGHLALTDRGMLVANEVILTLG